MNISPKLQNSTAKTKYMRVICIYGPTLSPTWLWFRLMLTTNIGCDKKYYYFLPTMLSPSKFPLRSLVPKHTPLPTCRVNRPENQSSQWMKRINSQKGQKFIVTLQKDKTKIKFYKWEKKKNSHPCTSLQTIHHTRTTVGLFIFIFLIEHFVMLCVHTKYSKLNKANK